MTIKQLMEQRAAVWDQMQALRKRTETERRSTFTAEERTAWDQGEAEMARLTAAIESEQAADERSKALGAAALGVGGALRTDAAGNIVEAQPLGREQRMASYVEARGFVRDEDRGLDFGKYVKGMVTGEWRGADAERRALAEGTNSAGGYMVPTLLSADLIDLARNKSSVLAAGAQIVPMESQIVNVAKWASDATVNWRAENSTITPTDSTVGLVQLKAQSLACMTQVSRELIEDATSGGSVGDAIKASFAKAFALKLDLAGLSGSGTAPEPRGVLNTSGVTTQSMGTNGAAPTNWDFLVDAVGGLQDNNETPSGIIYAPRTDRELAKLKDGQQRYLQPPAILEPIPRYATNQEPINRTQGTGTTCSNAYVGDWSQLLIGVRTQLQIQILNERYADAGQVGFLGWLRADVAVTRPKAFTVVTGIL